MRAPNSIRGEFYAVRAALTAALKEAPQAAVPIAEALQAVDRLERLVDQIQPSGDAGAQPRRGRRNQPKTYHIEGRPGEEALCEYRPDDPDRPFRCPRATYDALARVLAAAPKPAKFDDLAKRVGRELGHVPALYQLRVALRFWTRPEVGLVERARTRYRAREPERFERQAGEAWKHAEHS